MGAKRKRDRKRRRSPDERALSRSKGGGGRRLRGVRRKRHSFIRHAKGGFLSMDPVTDGFGSDFEIEMPTTVAENPIEDRPPEGPYTEEYVEF